MRFYGFQMASFEILRAYLQTLTNDKISYGMKHFLSEDDVAHITRRQHPEFDRVRMFNPLMWLSILSEPALASNLRFTAKKSESLIAHNLKYPREAGGVGRVEEGLGHGDERSIQEIPGQRDNRGSRPPDRAGACPVGA